MKINSFCLTCLIQMQESQIRKYDDEEKKMRYMQEVLAFLSVCNPDLEVTAVVRGEPVVNDADLEAARYVGLDRVVKVMGNGSGIAGTDLDDISDEARNEIETADVILSKGQGNFETIHGCGLNIYYLFLCKCDWFVQKFGVERFEGMFVNERRIPQ